MANENPPTKNTAWTCNITLEDFINPGLLKTNPTIAAGDFKISIDGGAFANLATLPTVSPASSAGVLIELSSSEMNGDRILVKWEDQTSPPEWCSDSLCILTTA